MQTVADHFVGLRYETVRRQPGPSDAERKLEELTRQLEVEMRLGSSPPGHSLSTSQRSPAATGVPSQLDHPSSPVDVTRAVPACPPTCSKCLALLYF